MHDFSLIGSFFKTLIKGFFEFQSDSGKVC